VRTRFILLLLALCLPFSARTETPEEWISIGERIHGGFGALIPLGIKIGLDALERLDAKPREVTVTYFDGEKTPCPCVVDGIMIATAASPGQKTLRISAETAPAGLMGVAIIQHRVTGRTVQYEIPAASLSRLLEWNKAYDARGRYDAVMAANDLFTVKGAQ
jgi:formylmethanofuran dehydrogenase subunit E